jgi:hypothetical protein
MVPKETPSFPNKGDDVSQLFGDYVGATGAFGDQPVTQKNSGGTELENYGGDRSDS